MELLKLFLTFSVFASVILYVQAAPTSEPPRTLEHDTDVNPELANRDSHDVTTNERFYRVNEDGSIEFKTALSNGHIQYQRITNKVVDGKTIQVYEGYTSQRYADGRYGTTYYIADENGYRRTKVETDINPPTLPPSGPYPPELARTNKPEYELGNRILDVGRSVPPKPIDDDQPTFEGELVHPKGVKRGTDLESQLPNDEEENLNEVLPAGENEVTTETLADKGVSTPITPNTNIAEENLNHSVTEQDVAKNQKDNHEKILITADEKTDLDLPETSEEKKVNLVKEQWSDLAASTSDKNIESGDVPIVSEENRSTEENLNNSQVFASDQATKVSTSRTTENSFNEDVSIASLPAEDEELASTNENDDTTTEENMDTVTEEPTANFEKDFITSTVLPFEEYVTDEELASATENIESIAQQTEEPSNIGTIRTNEYLQKSVDKFTEIPVTTEHIQTEYLPDDDISTFPAVDVTKKTSTLFEDYENAITTLQPDTIDDDKIVNTEPPAFLPSEDINGRGFDVSTTAQTTYTHEYDNTASKENNSNGIQGTSLEDANDSETAAPLDSSVTESPEEKSLEEFSADISNTELSLAEKENASTEVPATVPTKLNETKILEEDLTALEGFNNITSESTEKKTSEDNENEENIEESTEQLSVNHKYPYAEYLANEDEVATTTTTEEIEHKTGEGDESKASVIRI